MLKSINTLKMTSLIAAAIFMSVFVMLPATSSAQAIDDASKTAACDGLGVSGSECDGTSGSSVNKLVASIVNILSWVVGVAAVIMLIVGGFRYVTSAGDSNSVGAAKNTILYALVGLVIAVLAQAIVQFVLRRATT